MRSLLQVLFLSCCLIAQINSITNLYAQEESSNKHVIGARQCGFFSEFLRVLAHLVWCETSGKQPVVYWDRPFLYYEPEGWNNTKNAWEYYFEPVSTASYSPNDKIDRVFRAPNEFFFPWRDFSEIEMMRPLAHHIIEKYIKIKPFILDIVDDFYNKHMKNCITVGIHVRGTNKGTEVKNIINPADIVKKAQKYAYIGTSTGKKVKYLIASDDQRLFDFVQAELCKNIGENPDDVILGEIISYPAERAKGSGTNYGWFADMPPQKNGFFAQRGLDVLVEVLLLSRCDYFVHAVSNVSTAVIFFNPNLIHYQFDGFAKINEEKHSKKPAKKSTKNRQKRNLRRSVKNLIR